VGVVSGMVGGGGGGEYVYAPPLSMCNICGVTR